ncbi:hypothetical protein ACUXAV_006167 [Cupriavidus metallidurans]|uniref:hypothetical protein n=1 Tax=Cupriavidus TaxID=106589 RepID=UPI0002A37433|nr:MULTISPECIES: hypothetical protein [Cupriavidus]EKZ98471.1 hypothetical protein D769_15003 [Cupriavidus sp. HMR-1]KWR85453.1 hypothetical protein RN01_05375 [Cupriavidus sp. SHE]MDE4920225.1 hypothetical protein [Cupriavidus metallidurans]GMG94584.1 hypothetical protein Cmtc_58040 [Cupriavidus sp. TKC]
MAFVRCIAVVFGAALVTLSAFAQDDHQAHHPAGSSAPTAAAPLVPSVEGMDAQMKSMQAMHERMVAAKTPEERKALMAEHMPAMRDGMAMMSAMKEGTESAPPSERQRMLEMRMDMCQSMMQLMMDRLPESVK